MELWGWERSEVVTLLAWAVTPDNDKLGVVSMMGIPRESGRLLLDKLRQAGRRLQHTKGSG
jgi:hypothetical protein